MRPQRLVTALAIAALTPILVPAQERIPAPREGAEPPTALVASPVPACEPACSTKPVCNPKVVVDCPPAQVIVRQAPVTACATGQCGILKRHVPCPPPQTTTVQSLQVAVPQTVVTAMPVTTLTAVPVMTAVPTSQFQMATVASVPVQAPPTVASVQVLQSYQAPMMASVQTAPQVVVNAAPQFEVATAPATFQVLTVQQPRPSAQPSAIPSSTPPCAEEDLKAALAALRRANASALAYQQRPASAGVSSVADDDANKKIEKLQSDLQDLQKINKELLELINQQQGKK